MVIRLLLNHHIFADTIINHFLFDKKYEPLIFQYFEGIMGTFSRQEKWGTYLFWGISKKGNYRVSLWKKGDFLVSEDGSFQLEMKPEILKKALEDGQLLPSMMLIFIVLSFYYGLKCLGGFNQVNYLTYMKNAYIKMQSDLGNYRSIEMCARAQTKEIGEDMTIAFLSGSKGELVLATGLDLIIYGQDNLWQCLSEQTKKITLEEALNTMMPDFYRAIYPDSQRERGLLDITDAHINSLTELDKKIVPCIKFPLV